MPATLARQDEVAPTSPARPVRGLFQQGVSVAAGRGAVGAVALKKKEGGISTPFQSVDGDVEGIVSIRVDEFDLVGSDNGTGRIPSAVLDQRNCLPVKADYPGIGGVLPDRGTGFVREAELSRKDRSSCSVTLMVMVYPEKLVYPIPYS